MSLETSHAPNQDQVEILAEKKIHLNSGKDLFKFSLNYKGDNKDYYVIAGSVEKAPSENDLSRELKWLSYEENLLAGRKNPEKDKEEISKYGESLSLELDRPYSSDKPWNMEFHPLFPNMSAQQAMGALYERKTKVQA